MNSSLYYQYNPWWEDRDYSLAMVVERPLIVTKLLSLVKIKTAVFLTGLRRVGKTTLMKILITKLLQDGVDPVHIFYVSLDDYLLKDISILEIIDEYRKIHRLQRDVKLYVFLDEITYKKNFRQQLKNIYDLQNVKIFASASSSSELRDKRGFLTGREIVIEVLPLNFEEFLLFRGITLKKRDEFLKDSYMEEYLQMGGIPEYILTRDREYLTALVDDIVYKDIIAFHNLKDHYLLKDYMMLLMERAGKQISINKIANILGIATDTARRYLQMFVDSYLISLVPRFGKTNEVILSPKKVYATDLGIRNLFTGFRDKGAAFEHVVFAAIKHLHPKYYLKNGLEIDFITENKILIEVKYNHEIAAEQLELFNNTVATKKIIIKNVLDLQKLETIISKPITLT